MIKNLIFDFGDVFINLNKQATKVKMTQFGLKEVTDDMNSINNQYEKGEISSEAFVSFYASHFPEVHKNDLIEAWNAIILNFPEYRLTFIENLALKNDFNLFLLSNTNKLHIQKVKENMGIDRYNRFKSCFQKFYLSHEIGMRKPNANSYQFVLDDNNIKAEETLFIDDTSENTEAAALLKMNTWTLRPSIDDVINLFKNPVFAI